MPDRWVIDVRDLFDTPGASRDLRVTDRFEDISTELAEVPADAPVQAEVRLESVIEGILVTGPISWKVEYRCARCLKPFSGELRVEVSEVFARDPAPDQDEYVLARDGTLDLEPMIRDAVLLALPFSPLCRADCLGLCERCGGDRNEGECSCSSPVDPRWEPLGRLRID